MTPEFDIDRAATVIIKQSGDDAPIHAAMRADAALEVGDFDGLAVWQRVLLVIEELQGTMPKPRTRVH